MSRIEQSTVFSLLGQISKGLETAEELARLLDSPVKPLPETVEKMRKRIREARAAAKGIETVYHKTWQRVDSLKGQQRALRIGNRAKKKGNAGPT